MILRQNRGSQYQQCFIFARHEVKGNLTDGNYFASGEKSDIVDNRDYQGIVKILNSTSKWIRVDVAGKIGLRPALSLFPNSEGWFKKGERNFNHPSDFLYPCQLPDSIKVMIYFSVQLWFKRPLLTPN
jgi:hypothetical protein